MADTVSARDWVVGSSIFVLFLFLPPHTAVYARKGHHPQGSRDAGECDGGLRIDLLPRALLQPIIAYPAIPEHVPGIHTDRSSLKV